jgi:hypothetical protein
MRSCRRTAYDTLIGRMMGRSKPEIDADRPFRISNARVQAINESRSFSIRTRCSFFVASTLREVVKKDLWSSSRLKSITHLSPGFLRGKMERVQLFGNPDLNLD